MLHRGAKVADDIPERTVTDDLIRKVFEIDVKVQRHSDGTPASAAAADDGHRLAPELKFPCNRCELEIHALDTHNISWRRLSPHAIQAHELDKGSTVRLLGRYQGKSGEIEIVECSWDGTRIYFEEGVRQSQATPDGESVFTYVKLMDELLHRSTSILVLGCGGGNLATRLARLGKN